jgi:putative ABC transport system permease protein
LPLTGSGPLFPYAYNEATARNWESETSDVRNVSPDYFRAMGTRVVAGRAFTEQDRGRNNLIIVDRTLAARAWPGEDPVGKRLQTSPNGQENRYSEVIGVVEHVRVHDLSRAVRPQVYRFFIGNAQPYVVVRASLDTASLATAVRHAVQQIDPDIPIDRLRPLSAYVNDGLAAARLNLIVMSLFGVAALLLSSVGVYGVFSYAVSQRTKEIGIRLALGQQPAQVRNLVIRQGVRMIALGTAIGLGAAYVLSHGLSALLYEVSPADGVTFGTMAGVLVVAALVGCAIPARRATTVDPLQALKFE